MPTLFPKGNALLASGRVANLPTVWSNLFVVFALVYNVDSLPFSRYFQLLAPWELYLVGAICASFLYVGGCLLGDFTDIAFDKIHRPSRPLPLGIIQPSTVLILALLLLSAAHLILYLRAPQSGVAAGILTFFIVLYALSHKKIHASIPWALLNMATCRGLLVIFGVTLTFSQNSPSWGATFFESPLFFPLLIFALAVAFYTFLLSSVAASESSKESYRPRIFLCLTLALLPISSLFFRSEFPPHFLSFCGVYTLYLAWVLYSFFSLKKSKPAFVSHALAGFCLLDTCFVSSYSLSASVLCLLFFSLALILQHITPAT